MSNWDWNNYLSMSISWGYCLNNVHLFSFNIWVFCYSSSYVVFSEKTKSIDWQCSKVYKFPFQHWRCDRMPISCNQNYHIEQSLTVSLNTELSFLWTQLHETLMIIIGENKQKEVNYGMRKQSLHSVKVRKWI